MRPKAQKPPPRVPQKQTPPILLPASSLFFPSRLRLESQPTDPTNSIHGELQQPAAHSTVDPTAPNSLPLHPKARLGPGRLSPTQSSIFPPQAQSASSHPYREPLLDGHPAEQTDLHLAPIHGRYLTAAPQPQACAATQPSSAQSCLQWPIPERLH